MKNCLFPLYILIVSSIVGCAGYGTYLKTENKFQPTNVKDIHVYSVTHPEVEYITIGYISVSMNSNNAGNDLRDKLKKRAAELGADAIISFKLSFAGGGGAEGIAIKYK